jgi:hypothetical protein
MSWGRVRAIGLSTGKIIASRHQNTVPFSCIRQNIRAPALLNPRIESGLGQNPTTPSGSACPLPPAPDMTGAWLCAAVGHSTKSLARYPAEAGGTGAPMMEGAMELTLGIYL